MISCSLAIPHAPWVEVRRASLKLLEAELAVVEGLEGAGHCSSYKLFTDRGPHWLWSDKAWKWSIARDVTHCLFLTDDTLVAPGFWAILSAMVEAHPDEAIGLMSPLPDGPDVVRSGRHGYRLGAGVTGPGYLLPRALMREFVVWRGKKSWDFVTSWGEDSLINVFLSETGRYSWHPAPTCADHDIRIASTFGHENGPMSRPSVLWTGECPFTDSRFPPFDLEAMARPDFWATEAPILRWPEA